MKKSILFLLVSIFLLSPIEGYAQKSVDYTERDETMKNAQIIAQGLFAIGSRIAYKIRLKKSKKELDRMNKAGENEYGCWYVDEETGRLTNGGYDIPCAIYSEPDEMGETYVIYNFGPMSCEMCARRTNAYYENLAQQENQNNESNVEEPSVDDNAPTIQENRDAEIREQQRLLEEQLRREAEIKAQKRQDAIDKINATVVSSFPFDAVDVIATQQTEIDSIAALLKEQDDLQLIITGHTCSIGYKSINLKKGLQRAENVKAYFVQSGIAEGRISTESKGELEPKYPNTTRENKSLNRRVEFKVVE